MTTIEANVDPKLSFGSSPGKRASIGIARALNSITIEPVVFLYALGFSITMVVTPSLYMEKICRVSTFNIQLTKPQLTIKFYVFQTLIKHNSHQNQKIKSPFNFLSIISTTTGISFR